MLEYLFSFKGRIRRRDYVASLVLYFLSAYILISFAQAGTNKGLIILAFIPMAWFVLAQNTKRCHDRGKSGWNQLIPFYNFVLLFGEGENKANEYGPDPKAEDEDEAIA